MSNYGQQEILGESVSAVTATPSVELGTERFLDGNKYVYVYNKSTSTASVNYGVVYSAASGYSMTVSSVSGDMLAGVVVHNDIPATYYGWVCTRGFVDATCGKSFGIGGDETSSKVFMVADGHFAGLTDGTHGWTGCVAGYANLGCAVDGTTNMYINVR